MGLKSAQESRRETGMRRVSLPAAHGDPCPEGLALPPCADSEVKRPLYDSAVSVSSILKKVSSALP